MPDAQWTQEERRQALKEFFVSEAGARFLDIFSHDCPATEREIFLRDSARRRRAADPEAQQWWDALRALLKREPEQELALSEPLAQGGLALEDIYDCLPEAFEPAALAQAFSQAGTVKSGGELTPGISNTAGWSEEQIIQRLAESQAQLDLPNASLKARAWWEKFERENDHRKALILRLAENLASRRATVADFHLAYLRAETENIQAVLHFLDYTRLSKTARRDKDAQVLQDLTRLSLASLTTDDSDWWTKRAANITRTRGWTNEQITQRLTEVKESFVWQDSSEAAREWWENFERENAQRFVLVLRLAEELFNRKATLQDFAAAFAQTETTDIQANLAYFDYARLKAEEERKQDEELEKAKQRKQRKAARQRLWKKRITQARQRFQSVFSQLQADDPPPVLTADELACVIYQPRQEAPAHLRERFELALRHHGFETAVLDEAGAVKARHSHQAMQSVIELVPGVVLEMVELLGGAFTMGTPDDEVEKMLAMHLRNGSDRKNAERWLKTEQPARPVTVEPFYLGKFAITQEQWSVVAGWEKVTRELNAEPASFAGDDRPVESISWEDAVEFCQRLSAKTGQTFRLPTEAEWEYAARADTTSAFSFGDDEKLLGHYAWFSNNSEQETHPVGKKLPNQFGLYDMHGNVWEWCQDAWHGDYQEAPDDGAAWLSDDDSSNRVLRCGGCVNLSPLSFRLP